MSPKSVPSPSSQNVQDSAPGGSVRIDYESGAWHVVSSDGEFGGLFVSHEAARRFIAQEGRRIAQRVR